MPELRVACRFYTRAHSVRGQSRHSRSLAWHTPGGVSAHTCVRVIRWRGGRTAWRRAEYCVGLDVRDVRRGVGVARGLAPKACRCGVYVHDGTQYKLDLFYWFPTCCNSNMLPAGTSYRMRTGSVIQRESSNTIQSSSRQHVRLRIGWTPIEPESLNNTEFA